MNIAYRYLPYYVTTEEAEAEFTANKSRYSSTGYVNSVFAYILGDPVTQYTFNSDGTFKKTTLSYTASLAAINGTTVCKNGTTPTPYRKTLIRPTVTVMLYYSTLATCILQQPRLT